MKGLVEEYRRFADECPDAPERWLLEQSIALSSLHDVVVQLIAQRSAGPVLDLGTGYGPIAIRFSMTGREVVGVDRDTDVLEAAREIAARVLGPAQPVEFVSGDVTCLPALEKAPFGLVTASLLLEHVEHPVRVAREALRVLRPGGVLAVFDVDEGLSVVHPETGALRRLGEALAAWQEGYGGDRAIGRKVPGMLATAGFSDVEVYVLPQAAYAATAPGSDERRLAVAHLRRAREGIVADGLLSEEEFDRLVREHLEAPARDVCHIEGRVLVFGKKPTAG